MSKLTVTLLVVAALSIGVNIGHLAQPEARAGGHAAPFKECAAVLLWRHSNPDYVKKNNKPADDRRSPVPTGWTVVGAAGGPSGNFMMICH